MKKILIVILAFVLMGFIQQPDAEEILSKIDKNMSSANRMFESSMTIYGKRKTRVVTSKSWSEGTKKSFTEYFSPPGDKGTKMLKLDGQLWIYSPSTDRTIQISGHMLRQSVMGSDLSYEDMMDDRKLSEVYDATVKGQEELEDRPVWILELIAKVSDVAYHKQMMWVDSERYVPLKQELYAKSGQLLKRIELKEVQKIDNRWFPTLIKYKDMLKDGKGTEFKMTKVEFDTNIPSYIFSKAALKQ